MEKTVEDILTGVLVPQPDCFPSVSDAARIRLSKIDRELKNLYAERRKLQERLGVK